ncbi:unnamed protein product [Musa acuminata subsp. malaccensis]|uniref:(wild Malaysian banana) hypothetical protein n=1 Tax=Musa acuminata subsp. malaccensis TaxID=214687 RepID=A0A8D7BB74_MUSAM|nr:unnamed protein product [Musa acuminata subsp. malaccensis]
MADKPSRALVIYGDGHAPLVASPHAHLHSFASRASCGFLSLRAPPDPNGNSQNDRVIRELSQLLDAYDILFTCDTVKFYFYKSLGYKNNCLLLNFRFMDLRAAILTTCPDVGSFAANLGFSVLQISELIGQTPTGVEPPEVSDNLIRVFELLKLLGFSGGDVLEKYEFDLVILHIKPCDQLRDEKGSTVIKTDTDFLNKLVGGVMHAAQPGSKIACRLHFSIILGYGTVSDGDQNCSLILNSSAETSSDVLLLRPHQSYTMKSGNILTDIRHHHPMLIAQWQEGVTRQDTANKFGFEEFKERGGNFAILADRFLHEVAFKLWKAPKYGA